METKTKRKNVRKNLSYHPKDYLYIKRTAKKYKMKMTPFVLHAIAEKIARDI